MKKGLMAILVIWVILVVIGSIGYMTHLGKEITGKGPQALTGDSQGGFFLIGGNDLLHFNADEMLIEQQALDKLGLKSANSLLYENDALLVYDNERHRIFRCTTDAWRCRAFSPESLPFSDFISMAWLSSGELLISDNTNHRLVTLSPEGKPLHIGESVWHYPNQVVAQENGFLLADTDRFSILHLNAANDQQATNLLKTNTRPYQYLRRG